MTTATEVFNAYVKIDNAVDEIEEALELLDATGLDPSSDIDGMLIDLDDIREYARLVNGKT